jgi:2-polyprenyl-3-methyl-5-hydroxy-6-metoxy-1,4-benzoquinol methylase
MNCPMCAADRWRLRYQLSTYRVVRCENCSALYNRDFPEPEALAHTFSEHYYRTVQSEAFAHVGNGDRSDASHRIYELGLGLIPKPPSGARLLDVGCAFGVFLELATTRGWSVSGVEISPYSSRYARDRGLDVFTGDLSTAPHPPASFDVVTLWDVIEHVRDVRGTLARAKVLLKPGGHVIVTTDNFGGLIARLASTIYSATRGAARYPVERFFIPYNSCYLTKADVRRVFDNTGFDLVAERGIDYPIEKINLSPAERLVLRGLYAGGVMTGMTSQVLAVARAG